MITIKHKDSKIFIRKIDNNYLFVNQNNGAWFIAKPENKDAIVSYFSEKEVSRSNAEEIKKALKQTRFFEKIKKSRKYNSITKKYTSIIISATRECNLNCVYCWARANDTESDIDFSTIKLFVDKILYKKHCGDHVRFQFSGGEPSLKLKLIEQSINYIKQLGEKREINVLFQVQTNAAEISQKFINLIKKDDIGIGVSIDQIDDKKATGRLFFNGEKSTQYTVENVKKLTHKGIKPVILTTFSNYNAKDVYEIPLFMNKVGLTNMRVIPLIIGRGGEERYKLIKAEAKTVFQGMKKMIDTMYDINLKNKGAKENIYDLHIAQIVRKIMYDRNIFYPCAQSPCGGGRQVLSLFPSGDIFPCDGFYQYNLFKCGNIFKNSIKEIKKSNAVHQVQKRDVKKIKTCKDCVYNNYCSGGCIQDVIIKNRGFNEILTSTPYCEYYFYLISYLFELINQNKDLRLLLPSTKNKE